MPDTAASVLLLLTGESPAPEVPAFDPNLVTPGLLGFVVTFAMVLVVVLLLRDFSRRVRRIQHRGQSLERGEEDGATGDPGRPPDDRA